MPRPVFVAAPAALAALALVLAPPPPARAEGAKFSLSIKAESPKSRLGETAKFPVELRSDFARALSVPALSIGSPHGLVLCLKRDRRTVQVSRLFGKYRGQEFRADPPSDLRQLKRGETLKGTVELLAILPGEYEIAALYLGLDRSVHPEPLESRPVKWTVEPGPGGETRIGATIRTSAGEMTAEMYPEKAYNTVHNFLVLGQSGFYGGKVFHRIIKDFMVQTGDPKGNGTGGPGYCIPGEIGDLKHERGVLSMANEGHPNTAGSQFFICHAAKSHLDGKYTAFGKVVKGLEALDALASVEVRKNAEGELSDPVEKPRLLGVAPILLK